MKNTGYIALLLILLLQSGGMLFIYNVQQGYVQLQMSEKLKNSHTVFEKIHLTESAYQKNRLGTNEISLNGNMYDVKSVTFFGNAVELLVVRDLEEEDILEKIKKLAKKTGYPGKELPNQLHKLISLVYIAPFSHKINFIPSFQISLSVQLSPEIVSHKPEILSPPPKVV